MQKQHINEAIDELNLGKKINLDHYPKLEYYLNFQWLADLTFIREIQMKSATDIIFIADNVGEKSPPAMTKELHYLMALYYAHEGKSQWNMSYPYASFSLAWRGRLCRFTLVHASITGNGECAIFIRMHSGEKRHPLENFVQNNHEGKNASEILKRLIDEKHNLLICGATGSGKTTLLKELLHHVSLEEHIVTIEDTQEIHLTRSNTTSLMANDFNHNTTMTSLCSYTMRLSPHRIILGEVRGQEIVPLLLLLNTGHPGSMTTVHASSAVDALHRLSLLFSLFQQQSGQLPHETVLKFLCKQFHYVIFLENRIIKELIKINGADEGQCYFDSLL
jgi:Flp pilus assembly CpaF family ATPase